jgi:hypothetical protein
MVLASALAAGPAPAAGGGEADRLAALEQQIAELQARLAASEAARAQAEEDRDRAALQREQMLGELAGIRQQLAAEAQRRDLAAKEQARVQAELDDSAMGLRQAEAGLAVGSTGDADAALATAARAFESRHDSRGLTAVQAAQDALARSDLYQARLAIYRALQEVPSGSYP